MGRWLQRKRDASMPYQNWHPFASSDWVEIQNAYGDTTKGFAGDFWWGYEEDCGDIGEGVVIKTRRIARMKESG